MSVEWKIADVGSGSPGSVLPFVIEDQTPRAWRVQTSASVQGAPVTGVENVVIGVNNLDASIALFRKAYGWAEPMTENQKDWGKMAYFPGEPVILASPTGGGWLVGAHRQVRRIAGCHIAERPRLFRSCKKIQAHGDEDLVRAEGGLV